MTRPNIIRADTIDLQNHDAPSAKDHTRQPSRPGALGEGPPAPHQADALKHVELEINEQHGRSPRASQDLSGKELGLLYHEGGDSYGADDGTSQVSNNVNHNLGTNEGTGVEEDPDGDDSEDDMMDKISSSPSIGSDGGYHLRLPLPRRSSSLRSSTSPPGMASSPETASDVFSSSPFYETPAYFPLSFPRNEQDYTPTKGHHHQGGYPRIRRTGRIVTVDELDSESRDQLGPLVTERRRSFDGGQLDDAGESDDEEFDDSKLQEMLAKEDDPLLHLLDNDFDTSTATSSPASKASWDENEEHGTDDDDTEDISYVDDSRFVDSGWGGECLRETEEIDFEFVYALHTFVATVEGQANATKGDTMVLLDDSNSYWWLVRVVKDSSIGYLPAEHIETPLERLARLNKHRNLDLSQTMLGDEEEKKPGHSFNPLKKAIQRRNMKTVQFTAPSYREPSDVEYSTDEDGDGDDEYLGQEQDNVATQSDDHGRELEQSAVVEPLKTRGQIRDVGQDRESADSTSHNGGYNQSAPAEDARSSDDTFERSDDGIAAKSRKGTVRNTDSFFKDDSVETRKINLTPSLLRDDSKRITASALEPNEQLKARPSLDSFEKDEPLDKGKKDKKQKEKRGMLGGMFKRKDKKGKLGEKEVEETEKTSAEVSRLSPQPKESLETLAQESKLTPQPHRQTTKLQKSPPAKLSPKSSYTLREPPGARPTNVEQQSAIIPEPSQAPPSVSEPPESMRMVHQEEPDPDLITEDTAPALNFNPSQPMYEESSPADSPRDGRRGMFSPIKDALKSSPSEPKPEKVHRANNRMQMDDFDSTSSEDEPNEQALSERGSLDEPERHLAIAKDAQHDDDYESPNPIISQAEPARERLSESPVEVSPPQDYQPAHSEDFQSPEPVEQRHTPHRPPPLMVDTSSQEDPSTSPTSPLSSPELVEAPDEQKDRDEETPASTAQSSTPTWSDASLRAWVEDDSEIRDLLVVVHDPGNIKPARRDHPMVKEMYREENRKLGEISNRLDGLLGDYLARKRSKTSAR